jgi:hypothetical protein
VRCACRGRKRWVASSCPNHATRVPPFPGTLTTRAIGPEQLPVVWDLTLQSDPEGPTLISRAARLFSGGHLAGLPSAPSWRTAVCVLEESALDVAFLGRGSWARGLPRGGGRGAKRAGPSPSTTKTPSGKRVWKGTSRLSRELRWAVPIRAWIVIASRRREKTEFANNHGEQVHPRGMPHVTRLCMHVLTVGGIRI